MNDLERREIAPTLRAGDRVRFRYPRATPDLRGGDGRTGTLLTHHKPTFKYPAGRWWVRLDSGRKILWSAHFLERDIAEEAK